MSGVDNMNYMYSLNSTADGLMRLIVDYDVKTDPNTDLILTQMRSTQAASQLPADVNNFGVTVQKTVTAPLMLISLYSPNGTYDAQFLSNYAYINLARPDHATLWHRKRADFRRRAVRDAFVGKARPAGQTCHHRARKSSAAIQSQNTVNPAGQVGSEPAPKDRSTRTRSEHKGGCPRPKNSIKSWFVKPRAERSSG